MNRLKTLHTNKDVKQSFRMLVGFSIALPFSIIWGFLTFFIGREKAIEQTGVILKHYMTLLAELTLIPRIKDKSGFPEFVRKLKRNIKRMAPLYDISIPYRDRDKIVVNYKNCPHCEAFSFLGLTDLGKYACDSDWIIAEKNADKWDFTRNHQIGTGDDYCDHTYLRKSD